MGKWAWIGLGEREGLEKVKVRIGEEGMLVDWVENGDIVDGV
jgi:hypothetical protein